MSCGIAIKNQNYHYFSHLKMQWMIITMVMMMTLIIMAAPSLRLSQWMDTASMSNAVTIYCLAV